MRMTALRPATLLFGVLVLVSACAGATARAPESAMAPAMTVERFLRAVNQNDLDTMANLFGTRDGPIARRDPRRQADQHMFLLASVLRHSDYTIGAEQIVPGRRDEATQLMVEMVVNNRRVQVPFTLVRDRRAPQWLIEIIGVEQVTRGRS